MLKTCKFYKLLVLCTSCVSCIINITFEPFIQIYFVTPGFLCFSVCQVHSLQHLFWYVGSFMWTCQDQIKLLSMQHEKVIIRHPHTLLSRRRWQWVSLLYKQEILSRTVLIHNELLIAVTILKLQWLTYLKFKNKYLSLIYKKINPNVMFWIDNDHLIDNDMFKIRMTTLLYALLAILLA